MKHRPAEYLNRELSWLEFNGRVLEEAGDKRNPLLERLRFYCIFHSNMDEFYMVRVASLLNRIRHGDGKPDPAGLTPYEQLRRIGTRVRALVDEAHTLYFEDLLPALSREGIVIEAAGTDHAQSAHLNRYFHSEVFPVLTPIAIAEGGTTPRITGLTLNLAALLAAGTEGEEAEPRLAIVQVPSRIPGLCRLPSADGQRYCWLVDVVCGRLGALFAGYRLLEIGAFRLTRDSEVELDDEGRHDYVGMLEGELRKRSRATPVRMEYEQGMSSAMRMRLQGAFQVEEAVLFPVRGPMDPRPLTAIVDMPGRENLRFRAQPPLIPPVFEQHRSIFEVLRESDLLLHVPYDSFDPVVDLMESAAEDPDVLAVKLTLYRTSGAASPIVRALIRAAEKGKQVTVLLELTARFDEERNIGWAKDLEEAGAHVLYGIAGLKVHAKIALVVRREPDGIRRYVHLGTGNYNEKTARLYTDWGLLTAAADFGRDASGFYNTITGYSEPPAFERLIMAPAGMRDEIIRLIRREADRARSGQGSGIMGQMNSLVDPAIIQELYSASQSGVKIQLNVRGICCLRPGVSGLSENIRVVSILDRYLEHPRIFAFHNGGEDEVYMSSADWMPRNLDRRIELMFPVVQQHARRRALEELRTQFADNQKARLLKPDGRYERLAPGSSARIRVQEFLYRTLMEERELERTAPPARYVPIKKEEN